MAAIVDEDPVYVDAVLKQQQESQFEDDPNAFTAAMKKKKEQNGTDTASPDVDMKKDPIVKDPKPTPAAAKKPGNILGGFKKRVEEMVATTPAAAPTPVIAAPAPAKPSPTVAPKKDLAAAMMSSMKGSAVAPTAVVDLPIASPNDIKKLASKKNAKKKANGRKKKRDEDDDEDGEDLDNIDSEAEKEEEEKVDQRILREMKSTNDVEGLKLAAKSMKLESKAKADFIPNSLKRKGEQQPNGKDEEDDDDDDEEEEEEEQQEGAGEGDDDEEEEEEDAAAPTTTGAAVPEGEDEEEDSDVSDIPEHIPLRAQKPRAAKISAQQLISAVPDYIVQMKNGAERALYGLELRAQDDKLCEKLNAEELDQLNENIRRYTKMRNGFNQYMSMVAECCLVGWCKDHPEWDAANTFNLLQDCYVYKTKKVPAGLERELQSTFRNAMGLFGGAQLSERDFLTPDEFVPYLESARLMSFMAERGLLDSEELIDHIWRGKLIFTRVTEIPYDPPTVQCEFSGIEITEPADVMMVFTRIGKKRDANGAKEYFFIGFAHKLIALWLATCNMLSGFTLMIRRDLRQFLRHDLGCVFEKKQPTSPNGIPTLALVKGAGGGPPPPTLEVVHAYIAGYMKTHQALFSQYWMLRTYLEQIKETLLKDVVCQPRFLDNQPEFSPEILKAYNERQAVLEAERKSKDAKREQDNQKRRERAAIQRKSKQEEQVQQLDELIAKDEEKVEAEAEAPPTEEQQQGEEAEEVVAAEEMQTEAPVEEMEN